MNIFITLDYELYFGSNSGSQRKCIIEPSEKLIGIAERQGVTFSFFVDIGYLIKLEEYAFKYSALQKDLDELKAQLNKLQEKGHDIQLHIHPHWEDSYYDGTTWQMVTKRYKLSDFSEQEAEKIITRYINYTRAVSTRPVIAYRAGGWCMQPFDVLAKVFEREKISIDSTVFHEGYDDRGNYYYNFRGAPRKTSWKFSTDPVKEDPQGTFREISIASAIYNPLFFWKLFLLGRLFPATHKPVGDGQAMPTPGYRKRLLSRFTRNTINFDGYNAARLTWGLKKQKSLGIGQEFCVLGHPKAMSAYSFKALEDFIAKTKDTNTYHTYSSFHASTH